MTDYKADYRMELLHAQASYCDKHGVARTTLGNRVLNDTDFFERLESGGTCTMETYQKFMDWFKKNKNVSLLSKPRRRKVKE